MSPTGKAWDEGGPERLYAVDRPHGPQPSPPRPVELVSLIVARAEPEPGTAPEQAAVLRMCQFPLSVAEISAYLVLPVSTVTVLLAGLLEDGRVEVRAPVPAAELPDPELLQAVMHGLQNL
ncbi:MULTISPECIES: DUF742 domain-containing protein [unclassified Streptomyces]|uniref:DUF742 domain-containing protein n=1 Tax=unclassified Streptomyces TaxID=2593676 RepID=UPI00209E005B|nr:MULTISPECIES: DUF742 domain-containing protein [unclassified Streptomyces]MCO8303082.1 DUF742 domain-containing protein [Streptomyces sp. RKCA744]MDN3054972.1 DUF742 domain-containing protein [Streptomyces sp. SRF1]